MTNLKTVFAALLVVSLLGIAACGGDDEDQGGTTASPDAETTSTTAAQRHEKILIKTHLDPVNAEGETTGEVLSGSTIGDSAFCAEGSFADAAGAPPVESVVRTFRCPDGTLTIRFTVTPPGVKQRGDWKVVKGLVGFEGLIGGGRMRAVSESESGRGEGREIFAGTVTR
jgi:hypothetical protein